MSSPSKRRDTDVVKLMMSDYHVAKANDSVSEFKVEFRGSPHRKERRPNVWLDYPSHLVEQEEGAGFTVLSNLAKISTQALWCSHYHSHCMEVESSGNDAFSHTASSVEELDYDGMSSSPTHGKKVPLGPDYQADLPDMDCKRVTESDCEADNLRWLGERIWPKQDAQGFATRAMDQECYCQVQDTQECVRLHIREKREALKTELSDAFFMWGFDEMGEVVAQKWTDEEQSAFQELVRKNPESFWQCLFERFPAKCMADLVSYYFNVFVLRRRAMQNRIAPDHIDSDDDEMVLDSDERESDSILESNEDDQSQLGYDAASEDDEENGSMSWPVKDGSGSVYDKSQGNVGLQGMEATGLEESAESSSRAGSGGQEQTTALKESSSDCCGGTSNEEGRGHASQAWELLAWEASKGGSHSTTSVMEPSEREAWASPPSLCTTQDELISTKGMMEEFFGSEVCEHPS